jgi:AMP-binding enzyme C-terminal domain
VGLHPAERVREYREKGYWTDDTIDALFRARVAEFGDMPAVVDPLNRDTPWRGPPALLTALLRGWRDKHGLEILNFYGSNEGVSLLGAPQDIPDPAVRALYFPRYAAANRHWSFSIARWTQARIVDPETGKEITEAGVPGELKVADVAVVGYPDEVLGERTCVVVARPGPPVTLAELVDFLRGTGVATFKLPERLELRDELPRNPVGKILKRELRAELRGGAA